jgi:hypothetical protein
MDKLDVLIWAVGGGFAITLGLMITMWKSLSDDVRDIDRRLSRLEGAFAYAHTFENKKGK